MRHQVEHRHAVGAQAAGQEHQAQLRRGGKGQDALDVRGRQANQRAVQRSQRANDGDHQQRVGCQVVDRVAARNHVDAGRHHGGGVNQRARRRRSLHRLGQPGAQRQLRRLADRAQQQAQADGCGGAGVECGRVGKYLGVQHAVEVGVDQEDAHQEAGVADPVHHERLGAGLGGRLAVVVVADQQVRTQAHQLPADEQHHEVVAHHQDQHRKDEQRDGTEVTREAAVLVHVVDREHRDQKAEAGDHQHHQRRQRIDQEGHRHREAAAGEPVVGLHLARRWIDQDLRKHPQRANERKQQRTAGDALHHAPGIQRFAAQQVQSVG